MIEVVNRQRRRELDPAGWEKYTARALKSIGVKGRGVTIAFVSDRRMRELNRNYRGKRGTTDVLSFPTGENEFGLTDDAATLGDVVISVERAEKQAAENGLTFKNEIEQLILHGLLHLRGHDHEIDGGEMNALELRLRRRLGI
ncbi:MAG: rRNA maturation RNase YbeY [Pyrinomonadaceae bacterium]